MTEKAISNYRTAPDANSTGWPSGVKYIIGNEGCERFSYYGMRAILVVHLTILYQATGLSEKLAGQDAQVMYHLFAAGVYAFPMIGALIADRLWGKYNTILWLSLVYCAGHGVLAIGENSLMGMGLGLALIGIGSGGIKPCVSAHVGDQFGRSNWHLTQKVYQAFYFIINFGSFFSTIMIPFVLDAYGASVAFGIPGILMLIATLMFWMGRNTFVHIQPTPGGKMGSLDVVSGTLLFFGAIILPLFANDVLEAMGRDTLTWWQLLFPSLACICLGLWTFVYRQREQRDDGFLSIMIFSMLHRKNKSLRHQKKNLASHWFFGAAVDEFGEEAVEGPIAVLKIISVFFLVSVFWALFDQTGSSWVRQGMQMYLPTYEFLWWTIDILPEQIQSANPVMVMLLIPFNNYVVYPQLAKVMKLTPLRKMTIGMFIASIAFVAIGLLQLQVRDAPPNTVHVFWQILPYLILTQAEVMVSITGLEFAYTQAPKRMKSVIMAFWLLTVAFGNKLVVFITKLPEMTMAKSFFVFAVLMAVAALLFGIRAAFYQSKEFPQDEVVSH